MIQVIKHGYKYRIAVCNICKCEFSYEKEDVQTIALLSNLPQTQYYISCPECGQTIYLTSD